MQEAEDDWLDHDIQALELGQGEKAGLQIYRNYTRSFENHAILKFRESIAREQIDLSDLEKLIRLLAVEDLRFLPVITCAYADDLLKNTYKKTLPQGIPGGSTAMLSGYGPLSDLSKRIRLAYAFDVLSADLMESLDRVRSARNRISHDWDLTQFEDFFLDGRVSELYPVEDHLEGRAADFPELASGLDSATAFRVRLIWLSGRLKYESEAYHLAKNARLSPARALYEKGGTSWLVSVSAVCMAETRALIGRREEARAGA